MKTATPTLGIKMASKLVVRTEYDTTRLSGLVASDFVVKPQIRYIRRDAERSRLDVNFSLFRGRSVYESKEFDPIIQVQGTPIHNRRVVLEEAKCRVTSPANKTPELIFKVVVIKAEFSQVPTYWAWRTRVFSEVLHNHSNIRFWKVVFYNELGRLNSSSLYCITPDAMSILSRLDAESFSVILLTTQCTGNHKIAWVRDEAGVLKLVFCGCSVAIKELSTLFAMSVDTVDRLCVPSEEPEIENSFTENALLLPVSNMEIKGSIGVSFFDGKLENNGVRKSGFHGSLHGVSWLPVGSSLPVTRILPSRAIFGQAKRMAV